MVEEMTSLLMSKPAPNRFLSNKNKESLYRMINPAGVEEADKVQLKMDDFVKC